jgi:hypothetical protein
MNYIEELLKKINKDEVIEVKISSHSYGMSYCSLWIQKWWEMKNDNTTS